MGYLTPMMSIFLVRFLSIQIILGRLEMLLKALCEMLHRIEYPYHVSYCRSFLRLVSVASLGVGAMDEIDAALALKQTAEREKGGLVSTAVIT